MSYIDLETNRREFEDLVLEYKSISALALSWTIVHPINDDSPMKGLTRQQLLEMDTEFILMFKAFDETYAQMVHTRVSYASHDLVWGAKFEMMYHRSPGGNGTVLEIDKVGVFHEVPLVSDPKNSMGVS